MGLVTPLYLVGLLVMLAPLLSHRVEGWAAAVVWVAGVAIYVFGIALEERRTAS